MTKLCFRVCIDLTAAREFLVSQIELTGVEEKHKPGLGKYMKTLKNPVTFAIGVQRTHSWHDVCPLSGVGDRQEGIRT